MKPMYPLQPKSNRALLPGQFWAIQLASGRFACGRVLDVPPAEEKQLREFYAGLMGWVGDAPPTAESIAGSQVIEQGLAHIKTITAHNALILGCRPFELDGLELPLTISQWHPGPVVVRGYSVIRAVRPEERPAVLKPMLDGSFVYEEKPKALPTQSTWGYDVINLLAEKHFGSL